MHTQLQNHPRTTLIQSFALFAEVSAADCSSIISAAREKRFTRRETIFSEGNAVRQVIMLVSGCVKVTQTGLSGNEVILQIERRRGDRGFIPIVHPVQSLFDGAGSAAFHGFGLGCVDFRKAAGECSHIPPQHFPCPRRKIAGHGAKVSGSFHGEGWVSS